MSRLFYSIWGVSLATLPLFLYVALRLASSVGTLYPAFKKRAYLVLLTFVACVALLPIGVLVFTKFGRADTILMRETLGWDDYLVRFPLWVVVIIVIELTTPFLLIDLATLAFRWIKALPQKGARYLPHLRVGVAAFFIVYVVVRVILDTAWVRDDLERVPITGLPPEFAGLSITIVSDIQVDQYTGEGKIGQVRNIVGSRRPDILLSGGDLVTSGSRYVDEASGAISGLSGSLATVGVMGDHDTWGGREAVRAVYQESGWTFLDNEHRLYAYRGRSLLVTGLTYTYRNRLKDEALREFLGRAPHADLKILLVHQPTEEVVRAATEEGYTLVFAGHTHGGQIVVHPLFIPFTPVKAETPFIQGVFRNDETTVVVTRGVGLTLAPLRYCAPAEVTTVILEEAQSR